jgi:hypothetical protein
MNHQEIFKRALKKLKFVFRSDVHQSLFQAINIDVKLRENSNQQYIGKVSRTQAVLPSIDANYYYTYGRDASSTKTLSIYYIYPFSPTYTRALII